MRLLIAVFSLLAAAVFASHGIRSTVQSRDVQNFRTGQQYRYQLDTQISSGFASVSDQHAITRLQAQVFFQFLSDRQVVMRLENIEIGTLNRQVSEPEKVQPMKMFKTMSIDNKQTELLNLPVQFDYVNGIIEVLRFHLNDKSWSKNLKRSVLNMLQSNIKQRNGLVELQEQRDRDEEPRQIADITMFTLPEMTLEGECQTSYTINKVGLSRKYEVKETDVHMFNVTKSVDFKRCKKIADIRYGPLLEQPCAKCDVEKMEQKKLDRTTVIRQVFVGSLDKFGIQKVELLSHYMFKMINAEEERPMHTVVAGELNYIEVTADRQTRKSETSNMGQEEQLIYSIEWETKEKRFYMYGDEEFPRSSLFEAVTNKVNQIEKLVIRLVNLWSDKITGIESEATGVFTKIVELIRMCTIEELKQVHQKILSTNDRLEGTSQVKASEILIDALSNAGTYNTIKFLIEKIIHKEVEENKAVRAITFIKGLPVPSEKQVELLLRLCSSEVAHRSGPLRQTCWLTTGAIIGELCNDEVTREDGFERNLPKPICQREQQQTFIKALLSLYKKGTTRYEKILALKALGNAGLSEGTLEVEQIIRDVHEDPIVRIQAIDSLRRLRAELPQRIQRILMPIFQNVRERPVIRMAAVSLILTTIPENRVVDQIGYTLLREPSRQVKSYVYSAMKHLSESPVKIEKQLSKHLKTLLQLAGVTEETEQKLLRGSRFVRVPFYSIGNREGFLSELESMVGPDNYFPKKLSASIDTLFSGILEKNGLELTLNQENLENWYHKIYSMIREHLSFGNRKHSDVRSTRTSANGESSEEYQDRIDSMYSSLNIKKRSRDQFWQVDSSSNKGIEPFGMFTVRIADVDQIILPVEEEILPEYIKELILSGKKPTIRDIEDIVKHFQGKHFRMQAAINFVDHCVKVPTSMGFPIRMIHLLPVLGSIDGTIKAKLNRGDISVETQIHTVLTATHLKRVEIWCPIVMTGAETSQTIELNLPINSEWKVETSKNKFIVMLVKVPEVKTQVFGIHTLPLTFVAEIEKTTLLPRIPSVKCVENNRLQQQQRSIDTVYGEMVVGIPIKVYGDIHMPHDVTSYKKVVNTLLTSENHIHVELEPNSESPREIKLIIDGEAFTKHNDLSAHRQLKGFYSKAKFDDEYERYYQSETEDEDDNERFDSYLNNYEPSKMYKHQARVQLLTIGGRNERYGKIEAEAACDERVKFCQSMIKLSFSPLNKESREWNMKADVETFYPEYVSNVEDLEKSSKKNQKFVSNINVEWGCDRKQQINLRINGEQFKPKQWIQKISRVEHQDFSYSSLAEQLKLKIAFLNKFDISVDYKLQPQSQSFFNKYFAGLKSVELLSTQVKHISGRDGSLFATVVIDPITHKHLNVTVKTPSEKVLIDSIRLPCKVKPFELVRKSEYSMTRSNSVMDVFQSYGSKSRPECKVDGRKVKTFDEVTYKAPLTKCYSVLAKDCSSNVAKFAVLMKKLNGDDMKLKIISEKQIIEVLADSNGKLIVKINGDRVEDDQTLLDYGIDCSKNEININTNDVMVRFNGQKAIIKLAHSYKNSQCGLCGHYNDNTEDEFRMANNEHTYDLKGFHKSYTLEDKECKSDLEEIYRSEKHFRMDYDESNSSEDEKMTKKPIEKTQIVEYNHKVCLSEKPVKECPRRTEPNKTEEKKVKYQCFKRDSREARNYLREVLRNPKVKLEISKDQNDSYTETIEVPLSCNAY